MGEQAADTSCMPRVPLFDRLLLWPFGVARNLFFLQGLAFGCASAAAFAWTRSDVSPWIIRSVVVAGLMSGAFVVAGVLLSWMRSWTPTRDRWSDPAESVWPAAIGGIPRSDRGADGGRVCGIARAVASDPRAALGH